MTKAEQLLLLIESVLPDTVTAYHVGRKFGRFNADSLYMVGTGEGYGLLGPGIYFVTNKNIAIRYAKYISDPYMYTVKVKTEGIYDPVFGDPIHLRGVLTKIADRIKLEKGISKLPSASSLKYGKNEIGEIVQAVGTAEALKRFVFNGITGAYEKLGDNSYEIAVYDPKVITIVDKRPIKVTFDKQGYPSSVEESIGRI